MTVGPDDATDPRNFAWVSANAGSGKTRLLTDRVTRLLLHGADVSRILCLTYTKAAAAEMASRLFGRLGNWALLPDGKLIAELSEIGAGPSECRDLRRARRLFAQALETPGGLKIQTIHAFCQHLLARFPVEAGIPARFSVIDERDSAELLDQARRLVLEKSASGDTTLAKAIPVLAARANDIRFGEILASAIADRSKLQCLLSQHGDDPESFFRNLRKTLNVTEGQSELEALSELCLELCAERSDLLRLVRWLGGGSKNDQELASRIGAFVESGMSAENYELLRVAFFTTGNTLRQKLASNDLQSANPALAEKLERLRERIAAADDRLRRITTASLTEALLRTAFAVLAAYQQAKRVRAALDYDDLIDATIRLLESGDAAAWVLFKLDGGIDHILVDEGQDTSRDQWRIVSHLAGEFFAGVGARPESRCRRLFVVGDEKQSIFSFQGAEPAAFGEYREFFRKQADGANLPFVDFRPAISRRSAKSILTFVDTVFCSDAARDGLTTVSDPIHHDAERKDIGRVEIWPLIPSPERKELNPLAPVDAPVAGAHSVLASIIAGRIGLWLGSGAALPGTGRPIKAGDIMILVRRRNAFAEEIIREMLDRGIPVAGADRMVLTEQIAILDLLALGNFALLPEDDLNLAALLKSPVIGFSESDLYDLAQPRSGTLWAELGARSGERTIFGEAHAFLIRILSDSDRMPPFEFYSRILNKGVRRRLVARLGLETDDAIDEFLALALIHEGSHSPSLQTFLTWFWKGAGDVKRDMEQGGGAVRVMTVHGAKGLESAVVILPDTFQTPDHERRGNILYTDNFAFFGVPKRLECQAVADAKIAAHDREMREYRRLLYVAATRARDMLIVGGYQAGNRKEPAPDSWYALLHAAGRKIGEPEEVYGESIIAIGSPLTVSAPIPEPPSASSLPQFLQRPAKPERVPPLLRPSRIPGAEEPPAISPVARTPHRHRRGLLLHALLAKLPEIARNDREAAGYAYLKRRGIAASEAQSLISETQKILDDLHFAPLFSGTSRAEVAITARLPEIGGARISGQIDRLVVTPDSVLIADFKTNRQTPTTSGEVPRLYIAQMALYRAALEKIYPGKSVACALIWTETARLMPLPEELLDREMRTLAANAASISAT